VNTAVTTDERYGHCHRHQTIIISGIHLSGAIVLSIESTDDTERNQTDATGAFTVKEAETSRKERSRESCC
jgi:hypothetical protein